MASQTLRRFHSAANTGKIVRSCTVESFTTQCLKYIYIYLQCLPLIYPPLETALAGPRWVPCPSPFPSLLLPLSPHLILLSSLAVMRLWNRWLKNSKWHRRDGDQTVVCECERVRERETEKGFACVSVFMTDRGRKWEAKQKQQWQSKCWFGYWSFLQKPLLHFFMFALFQIFHIHLSA